MAAHALPPSVVNRLAEAFATSFWWSFAVCALAVLPALFLPGRLELPDVTNQVPVGAATSD